MLIVLCYDEIILNNGALLAISIAKVKKHLIRILRIKVQKTRM